MVADRPPRRWTGPDDGVAWRSLDPWIGRDHTWRARANHGILTTMLASSRSWRAPQCDGGGRQIRRQVPKAHRALWFPWWIDRRRGRGRAAATSTFRPRRRPIRQRSGPGDQDPADRRLNTTDSAEARSVTLATLRRSPNTSPGRPRDPQLRHSNALIFPRKISRVSSISDTIENLRSPCQDARALCVTGSCGGPPRIRPTPRADTRASVSTERAQRAPPRHPPARSGRIASRRVV